MTQLSYEDFVQMMDRIFPSMTFEVIEDHSPSYNEWVSTGLDFYTDEDTYIPFLADYKHPDEQNPSRNLELEIKRTKYNPHSKVMYVQDQTGGRFLVMLEYNHDGYYLGVTPGYIMGNSSSDTTRTGHPSRTSLIKKSSRFYKKTFERLALEYWDPNHDLIKSMIISIVFSKPYTRWVNQVSNLRE